MIYNEQCVQCALLCLLDFSGKLLKLHTAEPKKPSWRRNNNVSIMWVMCDKSPSAFANKWMYSSVLC